MRALVVAPGKPDTLALIELDRPAASEHLVLARTLEIGICGTDREIVRGSYGSARAGVTHLIIGHESLAEVISAPPSCDLSSGDLIVGIVRRPDPVPCFSCAAGEWDMCRNGLYTDCGIKGADGYGAEYFTIEPEYAVKLDKRMRRAGVLLEPASIVAKAWDHIERIGARTNWRPRSVLVTGAGTVGLLAALMGVQRGLEVSIFDRVRGGIKPALAARLGARYITGCLSELQSRPDITIECTGAPAVIVAAMGMTGPAGIVCLAGLSSGRREIEIDSRLLGRAMVLENDVVFGTVNANRRHYAMAANALEVADTDWLCALITQRIPLAHWAEAFAPPIDDVKIVIDFTTS